jgi:hypothetical protein
MTYSSGNLIQAADYNGFVSTNGSNVNATWNTAWGQTALATVAAAGTVSAVQWSTLNSTITSMGSQTGTTLTSRTNPTAGSIITVLNNLNTDIAACYTNRYNATAQGSQYTSWTGSASQLGVTGHAASSWTITFTDTITFANATAATSFFNAGGLVKIQFGKSGGSFPADPSWNNLASTLCGAIFLSSTGAAKTINGTSYTGTKLVGGTGTPTTLLTATGYAQLTSSPTTIYQQYATTSPYTGEYIAVAATATSSTVLTITTTWFSPARAVVGTSNEISGGTNTTGITFGSAPSTVVTYFPPSTAYLNNSWGTPTVVSSVSAPTY